MEFNKEQKKIINSKPNGPMVIKGEGRTGKTTAFINRIPSLLDHYCISKDDKVLIATLNEDISKEISTLYDNIEAKKYHQNSFFDEDNSDKLEIKAIDSLIFDYVNQYKKDSMNKVLIASPEEISACLKDSITTIAKKYEKNKLDILNLNLDYFFQREISWIKVCNFRNLHEYQIANRPKIINNLACDNYSKVLRKNSKQRQAVFEVFTEYNNNLNKIDKIDSDDLILLALDFAKFKLTNTYTHIVIDNAQRLSKIQLEFLIALYNSKVYSSITFILDTSESDRFNAWLISGRSFASLGFDIKGKSITLKLKYEEVDLQETIQMKEELCDSLQNEIVNNDINFDRNLRLNTIKYIDLKRNVEHNFIKDAGDAGEIYIEYEGIEKEAEEVISIPVFSEIAAGNPILMNEYIEDNYYLPKDWIRSSKDVFILKVKGDSMINKSICDGDYIVISKQGIPNINDIVAVDIDGEATLKTYKKINGVITLMPENEKYSPIIITDQQFSFLGVAIGLIKN